jgi:hypothetical protein
MANQATAISLAAASSGAAYSGACSFRGFWLVTSAAATVTIYDGTSAAGTVLAQWTTTATGQDKEFDFADGVRCEKGIYVNVSAGNVTGNVRVG